MAPGPVAPDRENRVSAVDNVLTGAQSYTVTGSITCPTLGFCSAEGSGVIDVAQGRSFMVVWQNTDFALCSVALQ